MNGPKNLCVLLSEKESNVTKNNAPFWRVVFCFFKENELYSDVHNQKNSLKLDRLQWGPNFFHTIIINIGIDIQGPSHLLLQALQQY